MKPHLESRDKDRREGVASRAVAMISLQLIQCSTTFETNPKRASLGADNYQQDCSTAVLGVMTAVQGPWLCTCQLHGCQSTSDILLDPGMTTHLSAIWPDKIVSFGRYATNTSHPSYPSACYDEQAVLEELHTAKQATIFDTGSASIKDHAHICSACSKTRVHLGTVMMTGG